MTKAVTVSRTCSGRARPIAHSHKTATRHPSPNKAQTFALSRRTFDRNFACQKSTFVSGVVAFEQASCRCQKQPRTSITTRHFGKTMSGRPGRRESWIRNRKPRAWRARLSKSSGFVFAPLIPDIILERVCLSTTSTMRKLYMAGRFFPYGT